MLSKCCAVRLRVVGTRAAASAKDLAYKCADGAGIYLAPKARQSQAAWGTPRDSCNGNAALKRDSFRSNLVGLTANRCVESRFQRCYNPIRIGRCPRLDEGAPGTNQLPAASAKDFAYNAQGAARRPYQRCARGCVCVDAVARLRQVRSREEGDANRTAYGPAGVVWAPPCGNGKRVADPSTTFDAQVVFWGARAHPVCSCRSSFRSSRTEKNRCAHLGVPGLFRVRRLSRGHDFLHLALKNGNNGRE